MRLSRILALFMILLLAATGAFAARPGAAASKSTARPVMKRAARMGNIVAVASRQRDLSTFVKAAKMAGIAADLEKTGPFTVFAPDNRAFAKVPKATMDSLMKPGNKAKLRSLLLSHVVRGRMTTRNIMQMRSPIRETSLQGTRLQVTYGKAGVMVGRAKVIKSDIMASNGVIQVINMVMTPASARNAKMRKARAGAEEITKSPNRK